MLQETLPKENGWEKKKKKKLGSHYINVFFFLFLTSSNQNSRAVTLNLLCYRQHTETQTAAKITFNLHSPKQMQSLPQMEF